MPADRGRPSVELMTKLEIRRLGGQGLATSAIGLGTMGMTTVRRAYELGVTHLVLAWLLAQGDDVVPIPGTRSPRRLAENVAAEVTPAPADLARIRQIVPHGSAGSRYPAAMLPTW